MRVRAQVGMVMALDKCIGCHTCSVTCKQVWTNRPGAEYMWFNDVETKPGLGYPKRWEDQERWQGGWELDRKGRLRLKAGGRQERLSFTAPLKIFRHSARAWALTLFYFLSFGGFVALFLYLPKLLTGVHHLSKTDAGYRAAGFALLAVIARPVGGWLSDHIGAERVLRISFTAMIALGIALALTYKHMVPLTITCLTSAIALGLGTGAVFKLVAQWFPSDVAPVTGVVGAAGGLGGFFPPLLMAIVKSLSGSYALGFILLAAVAAVCLIVLAAIDRAAPKSSPNLGPDGSGSAITSA